VPPHAARRSEAGSKGTGQSTGPDEDGSNSVERFPNG
jgi:hypothetical protein